jgi:cytoskeletal protein RodZ
VTDSSSTKKARGRIGFMSIVLWVLVVVLVIALGYMFWKNKELSKPEAQTKLAEQASQSVIDSVSKLIIVPEDKPTVATITDVDKLREANESFYKNAQNGDMLLLYSTQAIIYRSAENKIVNVAPVVVSPDAPPEASSTPEPDAIENVTEETDGTETIEAEENTTL